MLSIKLLQKTAKATVVELIANKCYDKITIAVQQNLASKRKSNVEIPKEIELEIPNE